MNRRFLLAAVALLIVVGLLFRLVPWGLPLWAHHFGGGVLWGAMIYCLVAALRPAGWNRDTCLLVSLAIVVVVETSRLAHTPALDAFRLTLAGQILLGRIFSPWNLAVDAVGVIAAVAATRAPRSDVSNTLVSRRLPNHNQHSPEEEAS